MLKLIQPISKKDQVVLTIKDTKGETIPARDGSWYVVTSATIPDKAAILRSRRD